MKEKIVTEIELFTAQYQTENRTATGWAKPIVGFADAGDPIFKILRRAVSPAHLLPRELLPAAKTVIAFFLPFEKLVGRSNIKGELASQEWAVACVETNRLIEALGEHLKQFFAARNYYAVTTPATHNFDKEKLVSNWSHRHIAYAAGIGNFGLNNMLITERGCCGRIGSFVTDLSVTPDVPMNEEACLYRYAMIAEKLVIIARNFKSIAVEDCYGIHHARNALTDVSILPCSRITSIGGTAMRCV